jgi:antitoxin component YwqK of YwqJK toxin-antitoxin module
MKNSFILIYVFGLLNSCQLKSRKDPNETFTIVKNKDSIEIFQNANEKITICLTEENKIKSIFTEKNNNKNVSLNFYPDGKIEGIRYYQNNKLDGTIFLFSDRGNLNRIVDFKNGNLNGKFYLFDSNAEIREKNIYEDGVMK